MNQTKEMLLAMKKVIDLDNDFYYIFTVNKNTHHEGCASFHRNGEEKIRVYEGSDDGSSDISLTYDEFITNYQFSLERE